MMQRNSIFGTFAVVVFALGVGLAQTGQLSGTILGKDGKALVNAKVVYSDLKTGRAYRFKTDKKGQFAAVGIPYGTFKVTISDDKGEELLTKAGVTVSANPEDNELKLDLSKSKSETEKKGK
jgi:hypothetical protein